MAGSSEKGQRLAAAAKSIAGRALSESKEAARATAAHALRVKDYGQGRWQQRELMAESLARRIDLGATMQQLGLGDRELREQIDELQERIRSLEAAGAKTKTVYAQLRDVQAALGAAAIAQGVAPSGAEVEFQAAQAAEAAVMNHQQALVGSQAALRPADRRQAWRIAGGYAVVALALATTLWAWGPLGSNSPQLVPGPNPAPAPGPVDPVADGGGGYLPDVPSTNDPYIPPSAPVFTPSESFSTCFNCNGTGQANCTACFGEGRRLCFACNGRMRAPNGLQCFQCNGTGRQDCNFCQYGKVQCPQCFGSGRVKG